MPTPYYERDGITIFCSDALSVLQSMPDASVDAVITDPPYFRVKGEPWDRQWKNSARFLEWLGMMCDEWRRILKPNGSLFVFASPDMSWHVEYEIRKRFNVLNSIRWIKQEGWHNKTEKESLRSLLSPWEGLIFAEQFGADLSAQGLGTYAEKCEELRGFVFEPLRAYLDGERRRAGFSPRDCNEACGNQMAGHYFTQVQWALPTRENYEKLQAAFNAGGGDYLRREYDDLRREYDDLRREYDDLRREYDDLRRPFRVTDTDQWSDVWTFRTVPPRPDKHPCEKPLALMEHIIRTTTKPGALIVDCFAGSGTTLVAARNLNRRAVGVEAIERYCEQAAGRLSQHALTLEVAV